MSITRDRGNIVFECDHCGEILEPELKNFNEAQTNAREEGWIARKVGNEWYNFDTEECYKAFIKGRPR